MILGIIIGAIFGMLLTSIVVIIDWDEHPKQERSRWVKSDNGYVCLDCFFDNNAPSSYCPHCGAKMGGIINEKP